MIPAVAGDMRYAQGGGLTAERRQFRERIRYEAGERFARGEKTAVIAKDLRVSERSVERWRRAWREGGMDALATAGPPKVPRLSDGQFAELEKESARPPAEHGWEDHGAGPAVLGPGPDGSWAFSAFC
ncbi:transposase [Streptomyces pseudovenezuelae]|uniref:Transposase n=1 Tax=Streptomyces pseudovenezuelae TaxID=67350 RepID=A0ABT6M1P0_9ACTN|nr:helix-turn-helix domain-containing protein [Streptomyces pseudovenezuelae]MDH6222472.1 transposase [Streptomyces pseudovenezuelae]